MTFMDDVLDLCVKISSGRVSAYKIIAGKLNSRAFRAVGLALKKNPFSPSVLYHHIVSSSGRLHGFVRELPAKKKLLKL